MIGVSVSVGDPLVPRHPRAEFDPAIEATIGSMAVPIGLAIEDVRTRGVNLLPKGRLKSPGARRCSRSALPSPSPSPRWRSASCTSEHTARWSTSRAELDAVTAQIAALPQPKAPVIDAGVVGDEAARATAVANVLGGRLAWDAVFRDLARVLPDNVWLSTLQLTAAARRPTWLPRGGARSGAGRDRREPRPDGSLDRRLHYTQPDVARLLARLATLPSLKHVTLTSSQ